MRTLLILDKPNTDIAKYFNGRKESKKGNIVYYDFKGTTEQFDKFLTKLREKKVEFKASNSIPNPGFDKEWYEQWKKSWSKKRGKKSKK